MRGGESFITGEYSGHRCLREALLTGEEVAAAAAGGTVMVCEAKVAEALAELGPRVVAEPGAADVLPFAVERAAAGEFDDAAVAGCELSAADGCGDLCQAEERGAMTEVRVRVGVAGDLAGSGCAGAGYGGGSALG